MGIGKAIFWKLFPWGLKNFQDTVIQSIIQQSLIAGRPTLETKGTSMILLFLQPHIQCRLQKKTHTGMHTWHHPNHLAIYCANQQGNCIDRGWGRYLFCLFLIYKVLSTWLLSRSDLIFLSILTEAIYQSILEGSNVSTKSSFTMFLLTHIKGISLPFPFSFVCLFCHIMLLKYMQAFTVILLNTISTSIPDTEVGLIRQALASTTAY